MITTLTLIPNMVYEQYWRARKRLAEGTDTPYSGFLEREIKTYFASTKTFY